MTVSSRTVHSVDVLVPTWNGREHLETCLPAVLAQRVPGVTVTVRVFDNGSTDGTAAWLGRELPAVHVERSERNLGFCRANNLLAERSQADALVLLNNDTRPREGWLERLVAALSSAPADVAAVSGMIVDWPGERLDFARGVMTFDGHGFQLGYHRPLSHLALPEDGAELPFACGGNTIVRRDSFRRAGGFDPEFFAYLEDVDLGWRWWSGGERVLFARDAVVHHRSMATSDLLGVWKRGFLFERNAWATVYKNYDEEFFTRVMPLVLWVLLARSETLLRGEGNPGVAERLRDPYLEPAPAAAPPPRRALARLRSLAREPKPALARALRRLAARLDRPRPAPAGMPASSLADERTWMQLRALSAIVRSLDRCSADRARLLVRRRRADREIFARFPLYAVPTYPGDEELFAGPGFASLLPGDVPVVRALLADIMEP